MKRNPTVLSLSCLIGLLVSLLLIGVVRAAERRALHQAALTLYTPLTGDAEWEGDWEFSELGADPSEAGIERVTIPFVGTGLALVVRRDHYRGTFFVSVDGSPANQLPQGERGAYLVLASPDHTSQVVTVPVASGLSDGPHEAVVAVDRAWDQWPLVGWSSLRAPDMAWYHWAQMGLGILGMACLLGVAWDSTRTTRQAAGGEEQGTESPVGEGGEVSAPRYLSSTILHAISSAALPITLVSAAAFYLSPWLSLTLASGVALAALILWRLDVGLALVVVAAPFYIHPRPLFGKTFSMAEILLLLCMLSWTMRQVRNLRSGITTRKYQTPDRKPQVSCVKHLLSRLKYMISRVISGDRVDFAVICFVLVAVVSTLFAEYRHVGLRELRVAVLEPALFYLLLRTSRLGAKAVWGIVDFFVLGAAGVAVIGLVQYGLGVNIITAEGGFRRLRSVYGSPNNAALYLGRVLPVLVAVTLFSADRRRRAAYGLAVLPVGLAILLTFSAGAFLLGIPLSLLALSVLAGGAWLWAWLGAAALAATAGVPLLRTPRFARLLDTRSGTTFFRLQLWRASWRMLRDHPWLGVGLDNFLYQYRGRYILPTAWQEPDLSHPHDILLDYGCRLGLFGLLVGLWLQIAFWRLALPLRRLADPDRRALAFGLMGSMVSFLAHGLVDASYFVIDLAFAFFLTLGVVQWLVKNSQER